jgi:hypothetical protein
MGLLRPLMALEAAAFAAAALVHSGVIIGGFEDPAAATAESIIGLVLVGGAKLAWSRPAWTRRIAVSAQSFALVGSIIGLYLNLVVGPGTVPDLVFHAGIVITLVIGLVLAVRATPDGGAG